MKKITVLFICLLVIFSSAVSVHATGIDILSSQYHIWGNVAGTLATYTNDHELIMQEQIYILYDVTSTVPVSREVSFGEEIFGVDVVYAKSNADLFSVYAESESHESFGVWTENHEFYASYGNDAFAEATWLFKPLGASVQIVFDELYRLYWFEIGKVWLTDLTTGTEILYGQLESCGIHGSLLGSETCGHVFDLKLDTTHKYSLKMYAEAESADDSPAVKMTASMSVLEPTTMLLLGFGLISLAGLKKRFMA